jgi:hypothetical protein
MTRTNKKQRIKEMKRDKEIIVRINIDLVVLKEIMTNE